jgi:hypothetical protein
VSSAVAGSSAREGASSRAGARQAGLLPAGSVRLSPAELSLDPLRGPILGDGAAGRAGGTLQLRRHRFGDLGQGLSRTRTVFFRGGERTVRFRVLSGRRTPLFRRPASTQTSGRMQRFRSQGARANTVSRLHPDGWRHRLGP